MKSSKDPNKKVSKPAKETKKAVSNSEDEDEDEKDAFDLFNPFGGKYKQCFTDGIICRGVDLSSSEPMFNPNKRQSVVKEEKKDILEAKEEVKEEPKQFISTSISFSFAPKKPTQKKDAKPVATNLSSFFLYLCLFIVGIDCYKKISFQTIFINVCFCAFSSTCLQCST